MHCEACGTARTSLLGADRCFYCPECGADLSVRHTALRWTGRFGAVLGACFGALAVTALTEPTLWWMGSEPARTFIDDMERVAHAVAAVVALALARALTQYPLACARKADELRIRTTRSRRAAERVFRTRRIIVFLARSAVVVAATVAFFRYGYDPDGGYPPPRFWTGGALAAAYVFAAVWTARGLYAAAHPCPEFFRVRLEPSPDGEDADPGFVRVAFDPFADTGVFPVYLGRRWFGTVLYCPHCGYMEKSVVARIASHYCPSCGADLAPELERVGWGHRMLALLAQPFLIITFFCPFFPIFWFYFTGKLPEGFLKELGYLGALYGGALVSVVIFLLLQRPLSRYRKKLKELRLVTTLSRNAFLRRKRRRRVMLLCLIVVIEAAVAVFFSTFEPEAWREFGRHIIIGQVAATGVVALFMTIQNLTAVFRRYPDFTKIVLEPVAPDDDTPPAFRMREIDDPVGRIVIRY